MADSERAATARALICALWASAPAFIVITLVAVLFDTVPTRFVPWWNDEIVYWNEIAAFARAGFDAGYVAINEQTPRAEFSRFGPHGPVFAVLYGLVARIVGWEPYSGFLINLVLVSAAAFVWLMVRRPASWTELALPAIFWPLALLLPTTMQEPLHFAVAFLLAGAAWRLLGERPAARTWMWAAPLLGVATLARPTWALMLLPLGWTRAAGMRTRVLLAMAAFAALIVAQQVFAWIAAPFPGSVAYVSVDGDRSLAGWLSMPQQVWSRAQGTLPAFLDRENGDPVEVVLRYVALAAVALLLAAAAGAPRVRTALQVALLGVALPLALVIATGYIEGFRDFRIMAPPLLFSVLVAGAVSPALRTAWWLTLLGGTLYVQSFSDLHRERFNKDSTAIAGMRAAVAPVLAYDPAAIGWGNTVLVHADRLTFPLLGLPPGLSVSYAIDWDDQPLPPRSRYLLLAPADEEALAGRPVRLTPLAETPLGTLYRNLDSK